LKKKNRTSRLTIRLTPEEYKHFLAVQRASNLSQADFLMRIVDGIPLPDKQTLDKYENLNEKVQELIQLMSEIKPV
jgi:hypothetical protein